MKAYERAEAAFREVEASCFSGFTHEEKAEFMGYLKLWQWIEEGRGHHGHANAAKAGQKVDSHKLSNRQQEQRLRDHFVSPRRVRRTRGARARPGAGGCSAVRAPRTCRGHSR